MSSPAPPSTLPPRPPLSPLRPIDTADLLASPLARRLYRPLQPFIEGLFGFPALRRLYHEAEGDVLPAAQFVPRALRLLRQEWSLPPASWAALRALDGPVVVVANHPFGGPDSLVLIDLLEQWRPGGWKLLSNHVLHGVAPLTPYLIPVDALRLSARTDAINLQAMRAALRFLRAGGLLAFFPARRVSHFDRRLRAVTDQPWSSHSLKLADSAGATVVNLFTPGSNSRFFLRCPLRFPRLRGLLLCSEAIHAPPRHHALRLASIYSPAEVARLAADPRGVQKIQAHCFLQADRALPSPASAHAPASAPPSSPPAPMSFRSAPDPGPSPSPDSAARDAIAALSPGHRLGAQGALEAFVLRGDESPALLQALGAGRQLAFRLAGQGVAGDLDLSPEDAYYHHLLVWDHAAGRLAGAYRVGHVQAILAEHGPAGLYLDHVFFIDPGFFQKFPHSLELSRSFVHPDYQKDNAVLPLLWRGLAALSLRFQAPTLFGSVTISNAFHPASRALLVSYLQNEHLDDPAHCALIAPRRPFVPATTFHGLAAEAYRGEPIQALSPIIRHLEDNARDIPPLLRYYCHLGARFLAFHVEASFQDALYCLLRVDLDHLPPAYRRRFFPA